MASACSRAAQASSVIALTSISSTKVSGTAAAASAMARAWRAVWPLPLWNAMAMRTVVGDMERSFAL